MKLTANFSLSELTKSQTAERKGIDNTPSTEHQENLKKLCENVLQPVRDHFEQVVSISSGYRSPELCTAIGSQNRPVNMPVEKRRISKFLVYQIKNSQIGFTTTQIMTNSFLSIGKNQIQIQAGCIVLFQRVTTEDNT